MLLYHGSEEHVAGGPGREINGYRSECKCLYTLASLGFLISSPRVEILYHSIHYIDLIRSFFGNPAQLYAKTTKHPAMQQLASVSSNIIMDYGDNGKAANILTNHCHAYGMPKTSNHILNLREQRAP